MRELVFKQLNITGANAVTELNGMPAQSFFTVLNAVGQFSEDQISNTHSFSVLHQWINLLYSPQSSYHDEFGTDSSLSLSSLQSWGVSPGALCVVVVVRRTRDEFSVQGGDDQVLPAAARSV
jgi:hypothetical protein